MEDISALTTFMGWCTLINTGLLAYSTLMLTLFREPVKRMHMALFGLDSVNLDASYFTFLGNYKLAILVFNLVPYIALKLMD